MSETDIDELMNDSDEGQSFRESLASALNQAGLDLQTQVSHNCLCCDVGAGREIKGLLPLKPKVFIASEPITDYYESKTISSKLKKLQQQGGFQLIRVPALEVFDQPKVKKTLFGLITWLNIFPEDITEDNLYQFFSSAKPFLAPGGVVVASVGICGIDNDDAEGGMSIMKTGVRIRDELGYKIDFPDDEQGSQFAGGLFLVATVLDKNTSSGK